jgi:signal peptidase
MESISQIEPNKITYIGPSMNPTLKSGDRLCVLSCDGQKLHLGDVVVFISPEDGSRVVHRVVSLDPSGIKTQGDNNKQVDPWLLSHDEILGRVVSAKRGNRWRRVFGGKVGQLLGVAIRAFRALDAGVSSRLRPAYDRLARAGMFSRCLSAWIKIRAISLSHPAGTELQLLMGRRVIGRWLPGMTRWYIRRPFRLFVDEAALPENPAKGSVVRD